jgi:hypothetical protein
MPCARSCSIISPRLARAAATAAGASPGATVSSGATTSSPSPGAAASLASCGLRSASSCWSIPPERGRHRRAADGDRRRARSPPGRAGDHQTLRPTGPGGATGERRRQVQQAWAPRAPAVVRGRPSSRCPQGPVRRRDDDERHATRPAATRLDMPTLCLPRGLPARRIRPGRPPVEPLPPVLRAPGGRAGPPTHPEGKDPRVTDLPRTPARQHQPAPRLAQGQPPRIQPRQTPPRQGRPSLDLHPKPHRALDKLCRYPDYADVVPEGAGGGGAGGDEVGIITGLPGRRQEIGCTESALLWLFGDSTWAGSAFRGRVSVAGRSGWLVLDDPVVRRCRRILRERDLTEGLASHRPDYADLATLNHPADQGKRWSSSAWSA